VGTGGDETRFAVPFTSRGPSRSVQVSQATSRVAGPSASSRTPAGARSAAGAKEVPRRKFGRRARSIPARPLTPEEILEGAELTDLMAYERPRTRGDCIQGIRPCPFVSCRYHLYLDVRDNGTIVINFPNIDVTEMKETCALDVADRGGATLEDIGALLNLTRERIRQLEAAGVRLLREMGFAEEFRGVLEEKPDP